ncbi:MAG: MHYT domain-containing protein [Pseudomonadota bacterium]|mgnify:CR=1 FL=1
MTGTYSPLLVLLSYVVAVIASFVALDMATRVSAHHSLLAGRLWLAAGATAMGFGIWSMHFIGMLAFHLPIAVSYDIPITLLSLLFAVLASGFALQVISGGEIRPRRLLSSGVVMGAGIAAMHYTGMAAMQVLPPVRYNPWLLAASVVIAIAAATAALWVSSRLRGESIVSAFGAKAGSALIMALAITGMHYTGMAAALFEPNTYCFGDPSRVSNNWLAVTVGFCTFLFLVTTLLVAAFDARLAERSLLLTRSLESKAGLEAQIQARTRQLSASSAASMNMMQDAVQSRKNAERALQDLRHELAERRVLEQRTREQAELLDKAHDAILVRTLDHRIVYWNKGAQRLYGWTAAETVGRSAENLLYEDVAGYRAAVAEVLAAGEWSGRVRQRCKDGRLVTVEGHATLVRDDQGRPHSILTICSDITPRIALEDQVQQSQRMDAIGQLTGGIAHDFNNLLTVILGNSELLAELLEAQPQQHALAVTVRDAARRGADLTRRLLAFARRQPLEARPVDAAALLAGMEVLLRRTLGEAIHFDFAVAPGLCHVLADPSQLENAILNLCINARDAMPRGGRIIIGAQNATLDLPFVRRHPGAVTGDYVHITVSDTGKGIAPENLQRVFEPFFTTKEFGKGTGLGLSMVYGFVTQSHGFVTIASEVDHGTSVDVYLPVAAPAAAQAAAPAAAAAVTQGVEKILLVEDDDLVRTYGEAQLSALGYRVIAVNSGQAALDVLRRETGIDLLFTDIIMPGGMNGYELARAAVPLYPGLRVLYTSGYTETAAEHQSGSHQRTPLLNKPYSRAELASRIRAALTAPA